MEVILVGMTTLVLEETSVVEMALVVAVVVVEGAMILATTTINLEILNP